MEIGIFKIWCCFKIRIWSWKFVYTHQTVARQPGVRLWGQATVWRGSIPFFPFQSFFLKYHLNSCLTPPYNPIGNTGIMTLEDLSKTFWSPSNVKLQRCYQGQLTPGMPKISVGIQMEWSISHFFWPEYSGPPLEVVHLFLLQYWFQPKFAVPFLTNRLIALIRVFGKGIESGKSHSC